MPGGNEESFGEQRKDEDEDVDGEFIMDYDLNDDQEDDDLLPIELWPLEEQPETRVVQYDNRSKKPVAMLRVERFEDDITVGDGDNNGMDFEGLELEATFVG